MFGFPWIDLLIFVAVSLAICVTVCTLAMEASVLFVPAFVFLFPDMIGGFPAVTANEAIGLAITVEFFGYTSSVSGYWLRRQIDFDLAGKLLALSVPAAVLGRLTAYVVPAGGLLALFGLLLVGLAGVIGRAYARTSARHTCLLCGDSLAAMRSGSEPSTDAGVPDYRPRTRLFSGTNPGNPGGLGFGRLDRMIATAAGAFAGLLGIAIGEISNTFLTVRKRVPVKMSTGTSALVLHLTILSALVANLVILMMAPRFLETEEIVIPWRIAAILAPIVIAGGQIGSYINSRLPERALLRALMVAYPVIGLFVLARTLLF